jgi:putative heme-binding domain-containing protein
VDPNREVAPSYIVYNAILKDGRILTGIIAGETATSLELVRAEGLRDTLLRSQIKELKSTGRSLMPEELEKNLSLQDIANLLDFIRGLGRKAGRP